jgi:hypothetical protein
MIHPRSARIPISVPSTSHVPSVISAPAAIALRKAASAFGPADDDEDEGDPEGDGSEQASEVGAEPGRHQISGDGHRNKPEHHVDPGHERGRRELERRPREPAPALFAGPLEDLFGSRRCHYRVAFIPENPHCCGRKLGYVWAVCSALAAFASFSSRRTWT